MDQPGEYWRRAVEPEWESIDFYGDYETFLVGYRSARLEAAHLFWAFWCQTEVRNGGFHQFFTNSTGILAPEALTAFRAIGLQEWASILEEAIGCFGVPFPRKRHEREDPLRKLWDEFDGDRERCDPFYHLDDRFYLWLHAENDRWDHAADEYARRYIQ